MTERRARWRRIAIGVTVLATVQAVILLAYRSGNGGGKAASPRFPVDRVAGELDTNALVLERADGTTWKVDALRGRPVVLHVWATWCRPCRDELPTLLAQRARIRRAGGELVLVSVDDDWEEIRGFFDSAVPAEVSRAVSGDYRTFTIGVLPETLVVDASGRFTSRIRGARDWRLPSAAAFLDSLE